MSSKYDYPLEKFCAGLEVFFSSSATDRVKIRSLYISTLSRLNENDFPPEHREKFKYIIRTITDPMAQRRDDPDNRQGTVYWACASLHPRRIKKIKSFLWELFVAIIYQAKWDAAENSKNGN